LGIGVLSGLLLFGLTATASPIPQNQNQQGRKDADKDITRGELARFDGFLDKHLEIAEALKKDPSQINNADFLGKHPELRDFLEDHPRVPGGQGTEQESLAGQRSPIPGAASRVQGFSRRPSRNPQSVQEEPQQDDGARASRGRARAHASPPLVSYSFQRQFQAGTSGPFFYAAKPARTSAPSLPIKMNKGCVGGRLARLRAADGGNRAILKRLCDLSCDAVKRSLGGKPAAR